MKKGHVGREGVEGVNRDHFRDCRLRATMVVVPDDVVEVPEPTRETRVDSCLLSTFFFFF